LRYAAAIAAAEFERVTAAFLAALVLVVTVGLCSAAIGAILARKLLRDRRERRCASRRAWFREAILKQRSTELQGAIREAIHDREAQRDLAIVFDRIADQADEEQLRAARRTAAATTFPEHLRRRLQASDPVERGISALLISLLRLPDAASSLRPLLLDPDSDVRLTACAGLGRLETPAAAQALVAALIEGMLPPERLVEQLGAGWAVPTLIEVLERPPVADSVDPPLSHWRAAVARALGLAGDLRAEEVLIDLLHSPGEEERTSAARALGSASNGRGVEPLIAALEDPAWQVRAQAATALGRRGDRRAELPLASHLHDDAWWVRANAASALARLGGGGIEILREAASSHPDRYARERAAEELALAEAA
jgi:HEAT repeat protein